MFVRRYEFERLVAENERLSQVAKAFHDRFASNAVSRAELTAKLGAETARLCRKLDEMTGAWTAAVAERDALRAELTAVKQEHQDIYAGMQAELGREQARNAAFERDLDSLMGLKKYIKAIRAIPDSEID